MYMFEHTRRVNIVAGIYSHGFHNLCRRVGNRRVEMHIRHERSLNAYVSEFFVYFCKVVNFSRSLSGQSHIIRACTHNACCLFHTPRHIVGRSGIHALQPYGVVAPQRCAPHMHVISCAPVVIEQIC